MRFKLQREPRLQPALLLRDPGGRELRNPGYELTYVSKADAQHAINLIMAGAATATVVEVT